MSKMWILDLLGENMTAKRFDWDVCDGDALFYENGAVIDYDDVVELLNELHEENTHIKTTLNNMIQSERTELGRSVLKQLKEQIK